LAEAVLISIAASLFGTLLAEGLLRIALSALPADLPRSASITIDARVLAFALLLGALTAVLFGALPAWHGSKPNAASILRSQSSTFYAGRGRLQSLLIAGQVALSLTLVVSAALLVQGFVNVLHVDPGINTEHTLDFGVALTANRYSNAARVAYFHRLLPRLAALPGVRSASAAFPVPLRWPGLSSTPEHMPEATPVAVEPDYFETLEVPRLAGRTFTAADDDANSTPVTIINQAFQRRYLAAVANPLGLSITPMLGQAPGSPIARQIIGVVADTRSEETLLPPKPQMYFPYAQVSFLQRPEVQMRVVGDPAAYQHSVTALVNDMDPAAPIYQFHAFRYFRQKTAAQQRFEGLMVSAFAVAAWTLSVVGLYALLAYTVVARTREIAIRLAVGAGRGHILGLVIIRTLIPTGLGFLLGLALSLTVAHFVAAQLYRVNAYAPRILLLMAGATIAMACCAGALPALRAVRLQPNRILREQ
jgi:putative ABC transport system permease protein